MADRPYRDLAAITKVVLVMLVLLSLVQGAIFAGLVFRINTLNSSSEHTFGDDITHAAQANGAGVQFMVMGTQILLLAMLVTFLIWTYRAMSNVHALGANGVESPGWTVGSFFIPFVNFVVPYKAMSQIWRASLSASRWQEESASIVGLWWAIWLIVGIGGVIIGFINDHKDIPILMAYVALEIGRNLVTMVMVSGVRKRQDMQWRIADNFGETVLTPS